MQTELEDMQMKQKAQVCWVLGGGSEFPGGSGYSITLDEDP